ncbi:MAG: type II toxin-antitoxin system VapC family toxin, partial [Fibromonadaceae bacterium]|nr:type II toxin-antitoxin system VapC family toxin [Fibromonadaceae bacterium]
MGKKSIYIETTIPSIVTARSSRDIRNLYRQEVTREFWEYERHKYDLYISQYVWEECQKGDEDDAKRRLDLIRDIPSIPKNKEIDDLAEEYFAFLNVPYKAKTDCSHLAVCVISEIDVLLSWNLTHLGEVSY